METPRKPHPSSAPPSTPHASSAYADPTVDPHSLADRRGAPPQAYGDSYGGYHYMQPPYPPYAMPPRPHHGLGFSYPNLYGHAQHPPPVPSNSAPASHGNTLCVASSSPPPACALEDYCNTCGHNAATKTKLEALRFEPGDPLDRILSVEYEKVGFKYCEWGCIVKADKAHRLLAKAWH